MAYPALTKEKLEECEELGLTESQIRKINEKAEAKFDDKLQSLVMFKQQPVASFNGGELRLVLLGKTGSGKSTTGNLIIGRHVFAESHRSQSCTDTISVGVCEVDGIRIRLIDTPGLIDTNKDTYSILTEIAKVIETFSDGIHGFLFVYNFGNCRFTAEEKLAFDQIKGGLFGPTFLKHCFVVITNGNNLICNENLASYMANEARSGSEFGDLLNNMVQQRVMAVENSEETQYARQAQREQIIRLIATGVTGVYTNQCLEEYKADQEATKQRMEQSVQSLAAVIEETLFSKLESMTSSQIKGMGAAMETQLVDSVLAQVMQQSGADPSLEPKVREGIIIALQEKKKRLTNPSFLEKIKEFAVPLLAAAGQILSPIIEKLAVNVMGKVVPLFMSLIGK